ncbi:MAG TPA: restriction endonuclease [Ideonella sp.]|uniref:restriction endonuclease n=1 Tax=Ideonella sp. TaxID=1929293 RepID=UPI002C780BC6|nr:restriction endonuclease [Ideonella sp.]HSI50271.1 restriction endonuclease [Ideonella sp.]
MGRRKGKQSSAANAWVELISLMPWWAGVAAALGFYLVLHTLAQPGPAAAAPLRPGDIGHVVTGTLWRTLAMVGQYLLPFLCLIGAAASAWRQRERRQLVSLVTTSKAASALDGMSWQQFERLVGEAFRLQGFNVQETGRGGPDGGVDLVLRRSGEKHLVQCKQWKAYKVGVDVVRELYGVMAAQGAAGGFVVTSGHFSREAEAFAEGRNVRLVDGLQLQGLIRQVERARKEACAGRGAPGARGLASPTPQSQPQQLPATPPCPVCTKPMLRRTARKGVNAGREFWGCEAYPACKGVRSV